MPERIQAIIKPELLIWARESGGFSVEVAAKKAQVKPEKLLSWERGESRPTIIQLRKVANIYKRPLAVFYLPEPPKTFDAVHDFRRLPGEPSEKQSPELRLEIRRAQHRRELALNLYEELEGALPTFTLSATLSDDPEETGTRVRQLLGIDYQQQVGWQSDYEAFNHWRLVSEAIGVLVFQATDVQISEARGFSISETPLPAVAVNIKDSPRGRIFTMLHEFVHLMLRKGGLCDLDEGGRGAPEDQAVEVFCNRVAGAALVPRANLLQENVVAARTDAAGWLDEEIAVLAQRYKASRETILRRLLLLGRTTEAFYRKKREELQQEYELKAKQLAGGFAPPHLVALSTVGLLFARLVIDSYNRERITGSDLSDYLEIRLKHLPKIEQELLRRAG